MYVDIYAIDDKIPHSFEKYREKEAGILKYTAVERARRNRRIYRFAYNQCDDGAMDSIARRQR